MKPGKRGYIYEDTEIIFRKKDLKRLRKKYHTGQKINIITVREDGEETEVKRRRTVTVAEVFPFHVSCISGNGIRESFGYFELEQIAI
ncbi:MAG: hypothetical protein SOX32_12900 [Candidatus Choladocola sp.]|nr:hypothetical protein [Candidatus Choladocola sp.]